MATSTAQAIATVPVYDYLLPPGDPTNPNPKGLRGKRVTVTLTYSLAQSASPVTLLGTDPVVATTDDNGFWQVNLVPNNKVSPAGTLYKVEIEGYRSYLINVTDVAAPGIGWQSSAIAVLPPVGGGVGYTLPGGTSVLGALTIAPGETGFDTNSPGALVIGDNVATSIELGAPTSVSSLLSIASFTADPLNGYVQLGTGAGGGGNGATTAQILPLVQPTFLSGTTLVGTDTTHVVVAGDHRALVGYYYVATGIAGSPAPNPSVPITSASFAAGNTTFVIPTIIGNTNGISYEISYFPGGTLGYPRSWDPRPPTVFKPTVATTVWQIGPNTAFYQVDTYGTVYLIGFNGIGANGDFLRDLRIGDLGTYAIENDGSNGDTSPAGTEPATVAGYLGYNGSCIKLFRDATNAPRSKSFEIIGTSGVLTSYAAAATAGTPFNDSPKHRFIGTSWTGAANLDSIAYLVNHVIDATGAKELQLGFEAGGAGAGKIRSLALLQADLGVTLGNSADPGVAGVWYDGTETFVQPTGTGNIFLRPIQGNNNNAMVGTGATGIWTLKDGGGTTRVTLDDGAGGMSAKTRIMTGKATPTYSASITPDASLGNWQTITVTNGTAFTINAPTNPPSATQTEYLVIEIFNNSGGAMGVVTFNAIFINVGGAFTNPASTKRRFIQYQWNGANWVEQSRASADY